MKPSMQKLLTELSKLLRQIEDDNKYAKIEISFENGVPQTPIRYTKHIEI